MTNNNKIDLSKILTSIDIINFFKHLQPETKVLIRHNYKDYKISRFTTEVIKGETMVIINHFPHPIK
ncbi:MAG: hypothetical protein HWN66_16635 [Candidatus Helarchaeota archaeon]|nr:hypothetical protein [Candidatus Helarchaeota archaeon]